MSDIQTRPFSKDYSGLINQTVIALTIACVALIAQEIMKRQRRGKYRGSPPEQIRSVESWEFGYLYQARCWAKNPSPPVPKGWPLSWVKESLMFKEEKILELRGIDATLYIRWLRACRWFILLHCFTTLPILLPIHVHFSEDSISPKSMTRASISSLVTTTAGKSLLWIHICLLFWVTFTWIGTLLWICHGAFYFRALQIQALAERNESSNEKDEQYHPHPHPQFPFQEIPPLVRDRSNRGLRLRTVMVENVLPQLRSEKKLKEYFEFYMSRPINAPGIGLTTGMQPGFFNKLTSFLLNRAKGTDKPDRLRATNVSDGIAIDSNGREQKINASDVPVIERVVIARKLGELAAQLERREDVLRLLETAHIKLANKALVAVKLEMDKRAAVKPVDPRPSSEMSLATVDVEPGVPNQDGSLGNGQRMDLLIRMLGPYVEEFDVIDKGRLVRSGKAVIGTSKWALRKMHVTANEAEPTSNHVTPATPEGPTIWDALLSLPRYTLDPYQPLISLKRGFHSRTVPSIDYYTAKLSVLTERIHDSRSKAPTEYDPVSTAFVTFANPADARRACKFLAVHPGNPLACLVTMAPGYEDLDWIRVMKSIYRAEFVKDWVVDFGVWVFTIFWLFPVSLLVGFVSIQSIGQFWPALASYISRHPWQEDVIQSFVPTILVSLLTLLIPPILLLIAKKAHVILTLSALHDKIMTRYYKFLIVNLIVFFCVGTAAVQTILTSLKNAIGGGGILQIVATSFPTAGPFYVGWLIFTTALHGGLEIALLGLPLIMYPSTKRQVTPRKRAVGIRPRTFNFYYWLPNHMLIVHILLLFAVLNPLVIPFGFIYFCVENAVVRNQLVHVYCKNYEGNGRVILIRLIRYSLDGLVLAQAVFLVYMVVLKKTANVASAAVLMFITIVVKLSMTRLCRAQYEDDDIAEANVVCGLVNKDEQTNNSSNIDFTNGQAMLVDPREGTTRHLTQRFRTLRLPAWINFSYSNVPHRAHARHPNAFRPHSHHSTLSHPESLNATESGGEEPSLQPMGMANQPSSTLAVDSSSSQYVGRHPPTTTWDDDSHMNTPYDNPYYTLAISNILWLPRDPFGILDLDDTIDLKVSLTSEAKSGQLGVWQGHTEASPPSLNLPIKEPVTPTINGGEPALRNAPRRQFTGAEEIELPPGIASRVANLEKEDDVEKAPVRRRPSLYRGQRSSGKNRESFASDSDAPSSYMTAFTSPMYQRNRVSSAAESFIQPDNTHASTNLSTSNLNSVPNKERLPTGLGMIRLAQLEEQEAAAEHSRAEQAEADHATGKKSWFTSWIYKRVH